MLHFFLTFQEPRVDIRGVGLRDDGTPPFELIGEDRVQGNVLLRLDVENSNPWDFHLESVGVEVYLTSNLGNRIGKGTQTDLSFPARTTQPVDLPLTLIFDTSADPNFDTLTEVARACFNNSPIDFTYRVRIGIGILSFVVPEIQRSEKVDCPFDVREEDLPQVVLDALRELRESLF